MIKKFLLLLILFINSLVLSQAQGIDIRSSAASRFRQLASVTTPCLPYSLATDLSDGTPKFCNASGTGWSSLLNPLTGSGASGRVNIWTGTNSMSSDSGFTFSGTGATFDLTLGRDLIAGRQLIGQFGTITPLSDIPSLTLRRFSSGQASHLFDFQTEANASLTFFDKNGVFNGNVIGNLTGNASTVTNGIYNTDSGTVTNTMLAGSIANNKLSNSTISNVALGSNLFSHTAGTGLTGSTYNGSAGITWNITNPVPANLTLTNPASAATFTLIGGKTFTVNNTLTLSGTDASTLNIGSGGTLGTNAFNSTAYAPLDSPIFTTKITTPIIQFGASSPLLDLSGSTIRVRNSTNTAYSRLDTSLSVFQDGTNSSVAQPTVLGLPSSGQVKFSPNTDGTSGFDAGMGRCGIAVICFTNSSSGSGSIAPQITTTGNLGTSSLHWGIGYIDKLGALTTNGLVKTSGSDGTLSVDTNTYLTSSTGVSSITGTTNQITTSASTGAITLSLPQNIHTSAIPQFARLGLGIAADANNQFQLSDSSFARQISTGVNSNFQIGRNSTTTNGSTYTRLVGDNDSQVLEFDPSGNTTFYTQSDANTTAGSTITFASRFSIDKGGAISMPSIASSSAAQTGTLCWTTGGNITYDPTVGCLASLEELKDKKGSITHALDTVLRLNPFWYKWKSSTPQFAGDKAEQPGLGAHQVESVDRRLVGYSPDGKLTGVRYSQIVAVVIAAVQEQQVMITNQQSEISNQQSEIDELKSEIKILKKKMKLIKS